MGSSHVPPWAHLLKCSCGWLVTYTSLCGSTVPSLTSAPHYTCMPQALVLEVAVAAKRSASAAGADIAGAQRHCRQPLRAAPAGHGPHEPPPASAACAVCHTPKISAGARAQVLSAIRYPQCASGCDASSHCRCRALCFWAAGRRGVRRHCPAPALRPTKSLFRHFRPAGAAGGTCPGRRADFRGQRAVKVCVTRLIGEVAVSP